MPWKQQGGARPLGQQWWRARPLGRKVWAAVAAEGIGGPPDFEDLIRSGSGPREKHMPGGSAVLAVLFWFCSWPYCVVGLAGSTEYSQEKMASSCCSVVM